MWNTDRVSLAYILFLKNRVGEKTVFLRHMISCSYTVISSKVLQMFYSDNVIVYCFLCKYWTPILMLMDRLRPNKIKEKSTLVRHWSTVRLWSAQSIPESARSHTNETFQHNNPSPCPTSVSCYRNTAILIIVALFLTSPTFALVS